MKTAIVFLALFAGIWAKTMPESEKALLESVHQTCQEKSATKVDDEMLKHLEQHVHDPHLMAHMLCMAQGTGMMTKGGILDKTVIKNKMSMVMDDQHQIDIMVNKCAIQKDTPMMTAMDMRMCFHENNIHYMHDL